mgnify:CR=1 FL=1
METKELVPGAYLRLGVNFKTLTHEEEYDSKQELIRFTGNYLLYRDQKKTEF